MDPRSNLYTPRLNLKSGWRTTEFWLSLVALLLSAAYLAGLVPDAGPWAKLAAFGALALTMLGYNVSRGIAKTARLLTVCGLAVMLTGCQTITRIAPDGSKVTATAWFSKIGDIEASNIATNGAQYRVHLKNIAVDAEALAAVAEGAARGAK